MLNPIKNGKLRMRRYLIPNYVNDESIELGLHILSEEIEQNPKIKNVKLFVQTQQNLKHTSIESVLREQRCKILLDGKSIQFNSNTNISLDTIRTINKYSLVDAVLAVYADQRMMDIVDVIPGTKLIIAISHSPKALDNWKNTWNPIIPGKEREEDAVLINNKIIAVALKLTTDSINISNPVLNPRDEIKIKDTLYILRVNNQYEDPINLRNWAVKNDWNPKAADQLMKYADRIFSMSSKPKNYRRVWRENIFDIWKEESEK